MNGRNQFNILKQNLHLKGRFVDGLAFIGH